MSNPITVTVTPFATIEEAVNHTGMDLSYNEALARSDMRYMQRDVESVFVLNNEVYYVFKCDIKVLNKYTPFHSVLDDSPFGGAAVLNGDQLTIIPMRVEKSKFGRAFFRKNGLIAVSGEHAASIAAVRESAGV